MTGQIVRPNGGGHALVAQTGGRSAWTPSRQTRTCYCPAMEFGLFTQTHVPKYYRGAGSARRAQPAPLRDRAGQDRRPKPGSGHVWASTTSSDEYSHLSANESWSAHGGRGHRLHPPSGRASFNVTPPVNHRPHRRAGGHARPPERRPLRVRHRAAARPPPSRPGWDHRPRAHPGDVGRGDARVQEDVGRRNYSFDGRFFSMPERNVLPSGREGAAPARGGVARQPRDLPPRRAGSASAPSASPSASPRPEAHGRGLPRAIQDAEPVGDSASTTTSPGQHHALHGGRPGGPKWFRESGGGYFQSNVYRYLDTFPAPARRAALAEVLPTSRPSCSTPASRRACCRRARLRSAPAASSRSGHGRRPAGLRREHDPLEIVRGLDRALRHGGHAPVRQGPGAPHPPPRRRRGVRLIPSA